MSEHTYSFFAEPPNPVPLYRQNEVPFCPIQPSRKPDLSQQPQNRSDCGSSSMHPTFSTVYNLKDVITRYHSQPDLLQLILQSKLEEDRRGIEEAKLRAKELDILLAQKQRHREDSVYSEDTHSDTPATFTCTTTSSDPLQRTPSADTDCTTFDQVSSLSSQLQTPTHGELQDGCSAPPGFSAPLDSPQSALQTLPLLDPQGFPLESCLSSSTTYREQVANHVLSPIPRTTSDLSLDLFFRSMYPSMESMATMATSPLFSPVVSEDGHFTDQQHPSIRPVLSTSASTPVSTSYRSIRHTPYFANRLRRRETQPITLIVETQAYPYMDGYFWKNNGSATQKKTGNKTEYYKCANSNAGCPVHKIVSANGDGRYTIKYRGEHIPGCK